MFDIRKKAILSFLTSFLTRKEKEFTTINTFGEDALKRLSEFLKNGKLIRGSLVLQSFLLFKNEISEDSIKIGSAIELMHAGLIIHDDVMDQDVLRRGQKSLFSQYEDFAKTENIPAARHVGESLGISVGDLCFFMAYEILSSVSVCKLATYASFELQKVALAQMQDVFAGESAKELSEEQIISLYKHKTGRYTFSLPLSLGAMLACVPQETAHALEEFGENLGIVFQIKDDELDLFGDQKSIGKPIGSDIRENKKTLFRHFLFEAAEEDTKNKLLNIFGQKVVPLQELTFVLGAIKRLGVDKKIAEIRAKYEKKAIYALGKISLNDSKKRVLRDLLEYNSQRQR